MDGWLHGWLDVYIDGGMDGLGCDAPSGFMAWSPTTSDPQIWQEVLKLQHFYPSIYKVYRGSSWGGLGDCMDGITTGCLGLQEALVGWLEGECVGGRE